MKVFLEEHLKIFYKTYVGPSEKGNISDLILINIVLFKNNMFIVLPTNILIYFDKRKFKKIYN